MDVQTERLRQGIGVDDAVVAKFSERNHVDPVWMFPQEELAVLLESATLTESMFVALEHMQVSIVTVQKTRLTKFRKNVIFLNLYGRIFICAVSTVLRLFSHK